MAKSLGTLTLDLVAKIGGFEQGLTKAERLAKQKSSAISKNAAVIGAAAATAALAAGAAITVLTKKSIDQADALGKMSTRTGIAVEDLSKLQYAAGLSGTSIEAVENATKRLAVVQAEAAAGTKTQAEVFERIGISATDASGNLRSTSDIIGDVADKFATYEDGAGKAALAQELFGKSGAALIPLLNNGRDGLAALGDEAEALGLVIGTDTAKQAELFNDNMDRLTSSAEGFGNQVAAALLPTLNDLATEFLNTESSGEAMEALMDGLVIVVKTLGSGVLIVGNQFKNLGIIITGTAEAARLALDGNLSAAVDTLGDAADQVATNNDNLADSVARIWQGTSQEIQDAAAAANDTTFTPKVTPPKIDRGTTGKSEAEKEAESLQKQYESLSETMREQILLYGDTSRASKLRYDTEIGDLAKLTQAQKDSLIAQAEQLDAKDMQADDDEFGQGQSDALDALRERYAAENEIIYAAHLQRYADLETFRALGLVSEEEYAELSKQIEEDKFAAEQALKDRRLSEAESAAGSMLGILKATAGEQSGIYKAMFAVEKAIGIARSIVSIQTALASAAASLPFPGNLGAIATVAAATANIVSTITSANPSFEGGGYTGSGSRTGGEDGKGGFMAMLHPNETVIDHTKGQGTGGVTVNVVESSDKAGQVNKQSQPDGSMIIDVFVSDIRSNGPMSNTMAGAFGLSRRGR